MPIIWDPRHCCGKRELVGPLAQQAMDNGFDGLIIESHICPDCARSDKDQQIKPDTLGVILDTIVIRDQTQSTENLTTLRRQIDDLDDQLLELLAKRLRISKAIAVFKKEHSMPVLQTGRYDEILTKRVAQAEEMGMHSDFIKIILEAIHEESVRT